jgi:hypothetical protein
VIAYFKSAPVLGLIASYSPQNVFATTSATNSAEENHKTFISIHVSNIYPGRESNEQLSFVGRNHGKSNIYREYT